MTLNCEQERDCLTVHRRGAEKKKNLTFSLCQWSMDEEGELREKHRCSILVSIKS